MTIKKISDWQCWALDFLEMFIYRSQLHVLPKRNFKNIPVKEYILKKVKKAVTPELTN